MLHLLGNNGGDDYGHNDYVGDDNDGHSDKSHNGDAGACSVCGDFIALDMN